VSRGDVDRDFVSVFWEREREGERGEEREERGGTLSSFGLLKSLQVNASKQTNAKRPSLFLSHIL
jgi:hypothetical protein